MDLKRRNRMTLEVATGSMNDIMFFLMLFFLIVSTMVTPNALKLTLPKSDSKDSHVHSVAVSIDANSNYVIDGEQVPLEQIEPVLKLKLAGKPDPSVVLYSDETVPVGTVVDIMNIANKMKIKMVLATSPQTKE